MSAAPTCDVAVMDCEREADLRLILRSPVAEFDPLTRLSCNPHLSWYRAHYPEHEIEVNEL